MTSDDTAALYAAFARRNPTKAAKYRRSIAETLTRPNIHDLERERLTQALAGLASVLGESTTCRRCHRALSDPTSVARHEGPTCHALAVSA